MFDRLRTHAFMLAAVAGPALALAADEHDKQGSIATTKQGVFTAATALVVFAIVFAVLAAKVWPVITRALDERADKIKNPADKGAAAVKEQLTTLAADLEKDASAAAANDAERLKSLAGTLRSRAANGGGI